MTSNGNFSRPAQTDPCIHHVCHITGPRSNNCLPLCVQCRGWKFSHPLNMEVWIIWKIRKIWKIWKYGRYGKYGKHGKYGKYGKVTPHLNCFGPKTCLVLSFLSVSRIFQVLRLYFHHSHPTYTICKCFCL